MRRAACIFAMNIPSRRQADGENEEIALLCKDLMCHFSFFNLAVNAMIAVAGGYFAGTFHFVSIYQFSRTGILLRQEENRN